MTLMSPPRGVTPDYLGETDPLSTRRERTSLLAGDNPALAAVMRRIDQIFTEERPDIGERIETASRLTKFLVGEARKAFLWRGTGLPGFAAQVEAPKPWPVNLPPLTTAASVASSPVADLISAVGWIGSALDMTERDVLSAAKISERTFYHWKSSRQTTPRRGSQADIWALVRSVQSIVDSLADAAPHWLKADPTLRDLFVQGEHGRLASLAIQAAAARTGVKLPTDIAAAGAGAQIDPDLLKRFRTNYPVRITHDEVGAPLTRATNIKASFHADEDEDEIVLIDVDE
jgi:hypothetical protein